MELNNLILPITLVVFGIFFYKYFSLMLEKFNPSLLVDNQFKKPQAFHSYPIPTLGGLCIFFSFLILFLDFLIFKKILLLEYISFCLFFFILGFLDDLKINIAPKIRLLIMVFFLILLIKYNNFYLYKTGIDFLNHWLKSSEIFSLIFVCLCFLFIVNGANLIDGYNGLLGIHSLIIISNLFFINYLNDNTSLSTLLLYSILILIVFLIFNFPKAKIFLGDSGSYLLGAFIVVSVIKTSMTNPTISPFYFCIILFYLFFEVFFSFFRKLIKEKKSPIHPDEKHLHMLLYKILLKKNSNKQRSNYLVSIIINLIYLLLIIPAILMMDNGIFCKYYSILFFIFYIFSYKLINKKN
jgi:UDP-GlcNAc:undecaprenyl-phosphate/decaprenyl-phosphate GlcNAc-1-phosphate transferase